MLLIKYTLLAHTTKQVNVNASQCVINNMQHYFQDDKDRLPTPDNEKTWANFVHYWKEAYQVKMDIDIQVVAIVCGNNITKQDNNDKTACKMPLSMLSMHM